MKTVNWLEKNLLLFYFSETHQIQISCKSKLQRKFNNFFFFFLKKNTTGSSHCGSAVTNPTGIHEVVGSLPGLAQWIKDLVLLWAVV